MVPSHEHRHACVHSCYGIVIGSASHWSVKTTTIKPIHTADETKLFCRVGGVYMNSRWLPTDSNAQHSRRRPVYNSAANGSRLPTGVFTPTTWRNCRQLVANSCTHRRRDATRQFHLVGVGGVYWALDLVQCSRLHSLIVSFPAH